MTTTSFTTPRDLLRYAVTRFNTAKLFFGHGSAEAFDEAAYLILHTLKLPLDKLDPFLDARLLPEEVLQVLAVIERRVTERVPAAYITNEAWLGTYRFYVDERVHRAALLHRRADSAVVRAMGGGPGCASKTCSNCAPARGCLAIMMADAFPNARGRCGRHFAGRAGRGRSAISATTSCEGRVNPIESDLYDERAVQEVRPDHHQPAVRERRLDGARCRRNTWPSRRSPWTAATTAWTWCARSSPAPPSA